MTLTRRELVQTLGATAGVGWLDPSPPDAQAPDPAADRVVHLSGDGVPLSPRGFTSLLDRLTRRPGIAADHYLLGGEVERFEQQWATLLG
ncbi:MAG: hypothetical protein ABIX28_16120, partial [Vicinamibacterales bacterium]